MTTDSSADLQARKAIEAVFRIESPRLIAGLARLVRDVGRAEELAQDAMVAALEQWPADGVPRNPGAWLMTTAKRRAVDLIRREQNFATKQNLIGRDLVGRELGGPGVGGAAVGGRETEIEMKVDGHIEDDRLRLLFTACHPALSMEAQVALTLRLLGGLTTDQIARAFLISESTVAQRIVRAKKTLARQQVSFEPPTAPEGAERLPSVLEVIYLIFNEGYSATSGTDWMRPELCVEAMRVGRILAVLTPAEAQVHALVALMEIQASRIRARTGPDGRPVLLAEQDRSRWDQLLIRRGLTALRRAHECGGTGLPYVLQAEIAACHARATSVEKTDWGRIVELYDELARVSPSAVIELNRAVALSMAYGPQAGLDHVDQLVALGLLTGYHLLPSVRGDLLAKLGRHAEARIEFERAASMTGNADEQQLLAERARTAQAQAH